MGGGGIRAAVTFNVLLACRRLPKPLHLAGTMVLTQRDAPHVRCMPGLAILGNQDSNLLKTSSWLPWGEAVLFFEFALINDKEIHGSVALN